MNRTPSCHRSPRRLRGYTLLELVVASATAAVLIGGLTSSLHIATQSLDVSTGTLVDTRKANEALATITSDLQSALTISELTTTAVTMTVPDRNSDSVPETIRYSWTGSAGDPIEQTYNGTTTTLATDVQSFSLTWLTRFIEGDTSVPVVLFVSGQAADGDGGLGTPTSSEQDRIDLMDGWGYSTTVISQEATQTEFDSAMSSATVVYVSGECNPVTVGSKLNDTALGVVTESFYHAATLGFYGSLSTFSMSSTDIDLLDSSHFITNGLPLGGLAIAASNQALKWTDSAVAEEAAILANVHQGLSFPTLLALDVDDMLASGGVAPGRRVQLPWGESGFNATALTDDGKTIMQRSLEWGAGSSVGSTRPLLLLVGDESSPTTAEIARMDLMESWGFEVSLATASEPQTVYDTFPASYDVVYVPSSIDASDVGDKLNSLQIGVVNEEPDLTDNLGFTSDTSSFFATETNITDNTHEITKPYSTGNLKISDIPFFGSLRKFTGSIGSGLQTLSTQTSSSDRMIMTLESGDTLLGGGTAPDRRVMLPWGISNSFDVNGDLTAAGRTIMHRAINWAAGAGDMGPVAHWMFDETSGTTAVDSVGGHDGSLLNGPNWATGKIDGGISLDGSNDYINVPHDDTLSLTNFTLTAWIKADSLSGWQIVVNKGTDSGTTASNYYLGTNGDEIGLGFYSGGWEGFATTNANLSTNSWHHIAGTYEDATRQGNLYLDGVLVHTGTAGASPVSDAFRLTIGRSGPGEYWPGTLDDVRVYDRALSATEIAEIYAEAPDPAGVVFEEFTEQQASSNVGDITIDVPPGHAENDLLIAAVVTDGDKASSLTAPAGWNTIVVNSDDDSRVTTGVWWKLASASEPSNYTFGWSGTEEAYGWIMRFTGHNPANPINVDDTAEGKGNPYTAPAVTTTEDNCMIVRIGGFDDDDVTNGDAGMADHTTITSNESGTGTGTCSGAAAYQMQSTAGSNSSATFTVDGTEEFRTVTIAIEPDSSP